MIIVIIGISFVVIINEVLIVFCHFPVFYDRKIKMEKKRKKKCEKSNAVRIQYRKIEKKDKGAISHDNAANQSEPVPGRRHFTMT